MPSPDDDDDDTATGDTIAQTPALANTVAVVTDPTFSAKTTPVARGDAAPLDTTRYRLGTLLGQGGMGEVVLAFDEQIGRDVAVKRIRDAEPSAESLSRFLREARVQGRLEHPAIVPVHDIAIDREGRPFFVMKRLTGTVMSDLLREKDAQSGTTLRRLLRAFVDVCNAIELAHSKGIVHRDLKPSNIMLGDFGEVYVLDWGIARALGEADDPSTLAANRDDLALDSGETRAGTVLGTPAYMAPEQLAGDRAGTAADLYSLGCVLYEIVSGEMLHGSRRSLSSIVTPADARPSRIRRDAPPELDTVCVHATSLDPMTRPTSARALGDAVQAFLDGDRDLAVRTELARGHLADARAALQSNDEDHRQAAMRSAGRALALDPASTEAAELVAHLVLQPPPHVPAEVEEALAVVDVETAREQARLGALALVGYLGFVPMLLWTGVRDVAFVIAFVVLVVVSTLQVLSLARRDRVTSGGIYLNACINAVLIGLICRMVGPFIIAPTLVTTTLIGYAAHPRFGRITIIAAILASAVIVPWALELCGVLSKTYEFVDGKIILSSSVITFRSAPVQVAFAVLLVALLAVVAVLSRMMAERQRRAARKFEVQAWRLRQLVPTTTGKPASTHAS
jgi:eukaryotic-like serine/threonine-protein kinase